MRLGTFTTTVVTGIAGVGAAVGAAAFAASAPAGAMTLTAASVAASPMMCGDGPWIGPNGIDVEGRPNFDAGDSGAAYIWHDNDGWHLRTTDAVPGSHHYSGTVSVSPDANVTTLQPIMLEPNDHIWLTSDKVIHYDFTTQTGVDGFDFTVSSCAGSKAHEALEYALDYNGREQDISRIKLGPNKAHPLFATFDVYRSV
jgi:hypothetical protein